MPALRLGVDLPRGQAGEVPALFSHRLERGEKERMIPSLNFLNWLRGSRDLRHMVKEKFLRWIFFTDWLWIFVSYYGDPKTTTMGNFKMRWRWLDVWFKKLEGLYFPELPDYLIVRDLKRKHEKNTAKS